MWGSFRDVADDSWAQLNAAAIDAQPAVTFEDLTDHVFIAVADLLESEFLFGRKAIRPLVKVFSWKQFL